MSKHNNKKCTKGRRDVVQVVKNINPNIDGFKEFVAKDTERVVKHLSFDKGITKIIRHFNNRYNDRMMLLYKQVDGQMRLAATYPKAQRKTL